MSCVYLHKQKKIGFVLSTKPFEQSDGVAYFVNYLIEKNFYGNHDEDVEYQEVFNTGFIECSIESIILLIELRLISLSLETILGFAASKPIPKNVVNTVIRKVVV